MATAAFLVQKFMWLKFNSSAVHCRMAINLYIFAILVSIGGLSTGDRGSSSASYTSTDVDTTSSSENSIIFWTTATPTCGSCQKRYIGNTDLYSEAPINSEDVETYAKCEESTECATVISVPDGYYILLILEIYLVPGDTLAIYDGDISAEDIGKRQPLVIYNSGDTTTDGDKTVESNGNKATLVFKFRYYIGHFPQSYYKVRYNAMKVDCLCPPVLSTQSNILDFKSPNYPHYYCPLTKCEYNINITSKDAAAYCSRKPVLGITLSFTAFDLAEQDYVEVYATDMFQHFLTRIFGDMQPTSFDLESLHAKVIFVGTIAGDHTGFKANAKLECGRASDDDTFMLDAFHLTVGTLAAIVLCSLALLVVMVVALLAIRENRRRRLRRAIRAAGALGESGTDDPRDLTPAIGPLPSYRDALQCMKWEPNAVTVINANAGAELTGPNAATFPPQALAPEIDRFGGPPPYSSSTASPAPGRRSLTPCAQKLPEHIDSPDDGCFVNQAFNPEETTSSENHSMGQTSGE